MDNINLYVDLVGPKYKKRSKFSRMIRRLLRKVMKQLKNPKRLKRKHKIFLSKQGCNPDDFLIVTEDAESYTFYNKVTKVVWDPIRRQHRKNNTSYIQYSRQKTSRKNTE